MSELSGLSSFITELKRRRVFRVAAVYGGVAFVLVQIIDGTFEVMGIPAWVSRLSIILLALGFPLAVGLAWVFDITPEGIVRTKGTLREPQGDGVGRTVQPGSGKPLTSNRAMAIIAILAMAFGVWSWLRGPADAFAAKSIAVLPFANISENPDDGYFSDGMTDEIISKLARIQNLHVISRTSIARFKGTKKDIKEIGEELSVRYVLEGSVRKAGNRVRITAQLIDASTGFQLWSDDFDGKLQDVFAVQEETALKIVEALDLPLSPQEAESVHHRYTQNPEAYDAYLRGWALVESFHVGWYRALEKLDAAREHFEEAPTFDPEYPLALAGLAVVKGYYYMFGVDRTPETLQSAEELAHRALALDPQLPEAHMALGGVYASQDDFERAIDEYRQALRRDADNAYAWCDLAWMCLSLDPPDPEAAEKAAREAIRLEPGYFESYYQLGRALELQGRYGEAITNLEYTLQLNPASRKSYIILGELYLAKGNYNQALDQFNEARRMRETPGLLVIISAAYAALGDKEKSLAELEKAVAGGYRDLAWIGASPHFASLRSDPRYQKLIAEYEGD